MRLINFSADGWQKVAGVAWARAIQFLSKHIKRRGKTYD
jgi:hypothetical protein